MGQSLARELDDLYGTDPVRSLAATQPAVPLMDISGLLDKALTELHRKADKQGAINKTLFQANNDPLQQAVDVTFSRIGTAFGKRNELFIKRFKHNTSVFAAFKTAREQQELDAILFKTDGTARSFSEFKKLSRPIIGNYNDNWLKTEHYTVTRSARMAANWKKFEETVHLYPNLEYMPSRATTRREAHKVLYHIILPFGHDWWKTHTPPLDWGCQCWIRQTRKAVTAVQDDPEPIPEAFQNNPGETAEFIRLEKHPYITGASEAIKQRIEELLDEFNIGE